MGCRELCPVLGEEATEEHIVSHEFYVHQFTNLCYYSIPIPSLCTCEKEGLVF